MKTVVVYESMYGNTHLVADAIAAGIREVDGSEVVVVPVDAADAALLDGRRPARGRRSDARPRHEPREHPEGGGRSCGSRTAATSPWSPTPRVKACASGSTRSATSRTAAAAFDTRIDAPAAVTGRASKGIGKRLRKHGCTLVVEPESFLVTKQNHLVDDEEAHARQRAVRAFAAR